MTINVSDYTIIRRRVKHARISVNHESQVRIIIPLFYRKKDLDDLLAEKERWILKQLHHFARSKDEMIPLAPGEILFLGKPFSPDFDTTNILTVQKWYMIKAHEILGLRLRELAALHGFHYLKLSIRNQKTRWGSCSKQKNISLNWKLIKTPLFVIDYLILHELTHTEFFDHSKAFWQKVAEVCPEYKTANAWLKKYGRHL